MINFETPREEVTKKADKIISECIDLQFSYRDLEHLIRELNEYLNERREELRSLKIV